MRGQFPLAHPWQSLLMLKGIPPASHTEPRAQKTCPKKPQPGHGTLTHQGTEGLVLAWESPLLVVHLLWIIGNMRDEILIFISSRGHSKVVSMQL